MKKFFISLITLLLISLTTLYFYNKTYFIKQFIWLLIGFIILFIAKKFKLNKIFKYSNYIYLFNILLLLLVLIIGKEINGAKAWFSFGFFSFQPSELMKLSLALYLSKIFKEKKKYFIVNSLIITIIPSLLTFIEPDTGSVIMFIIIYLSELFYSLDNKKIFYLLILLGLFLIFSFFLIYKFNINILIKLFGNDLFYRLDRILNFKDNYQLENALICIGSANILGRKNKMIYIPESVTDFIFARIVSIYGLVIGLIIVICYITMLFQILNLIKQKKEKDIFIFSFFWLFTFQIFQNIFMNIGLLPIIGISLPFLSYGGSNTIIYFLFLSIIFNCKKKIDFE